jgi:hypothetical protein
MGANRLGHRPMAFPDTHVLGGLGKVVMKPYLVIVRTLLACPWSTSRRLSFLSGENKNRGWPGT